MEGGEESMVLNHHLLSFPPSPLSHSCPSLAPHLSPDSLQAPRRDTPWGEEMERLRTRLDSFRLPVSLPLLFSFSSSLFLSPTRAAFPFHPLIFASLSFCTKERVARFGEQPKGSDFAPLSPFSFFLPFSFFCLLGRSGL